MSFLKVTNPYWGDRYIVLALVNDNNGSEHPGSCSIVVNRYIKSFLIHPSILVEGKIKTDFRFDLLLKPC